MQQLTFVFSNFLFLSTLVFLTITINQSCASKTQLTDPLQKTGTMILKLEKERSRGDRQPHLNIFLLSASFLIN